ncbi:MAG: hypothetical protein ABR577_10385 [Pyrinomonadaceae bacterium]
MLILAFAENSVQLVPDGTLFLHIAIILLMVYVLNATLFKPINRILAEREKRTKGGRGSAIDLLRQVEEKMNSYEHGLRDARGEGYRMMEEARAEAMQQRQEKLSVVREELSGALEAEKSALENQAEATRAALMTDANRIAAEIGTRLLHRPLNAPSTGYNSSPGA